VFLFPAVQAEEVILANMMQKISNSPDYKRMPQAEALADLQYEH
jgi:hypothetical protein